MIVPLLCLLAVSGFVGWYVSTGDSGEVVKVGQPSVAPITSRPTPPDPLFDPINQQIGVLRNWTIQSGTWSQPNTHIQGIGDSKITFNRALPGNVLVSFQMNVLHGMRPRIFFEGPNLYFGNEGYKKTIYVYGKGAKNVQGSRIPYRNGQVLGISMKILSGKFELHVSDQVIQGDCDPADRIQLRLQGGDGWSKGTTEFWDFHAEPVN